MRDRGHMGVPDRMSPVAGTGRLDPGVSTCVQVDDLVDRGRTLTLIKTWY